MRIPPDAVIDERKLTDYLLVPRPWDDKSAFLRQAGFVLQNWDALLTALRLLAESSDAFEDRADDYGTFYRTQGTLEGPTGALQVICIWLQPRIGGKIRFVTLKPARRRTKDVSSDL
jgi:hypothetical protein